MYPKEFLFRNPLLPYKTSNDHGLFLVLLLLLLFSASLLLLPSPSSSSSTTVGLRTVVSIFAASSSLFSSSTRSDSFSFLKVSISLWSVPWYRFILKRYDTYYATILEYCVRERIKLKGIMAKREKHENIWAVDKKESKLTLSSPRALSSKA